MVYAAGAVLWTAALVAGLQPPQASPPGQPPPAPTALILGRVVDAGSGRPIGGVVVTLNGGMSLPASAASDPRSAATNRARALTNANGQFVFRRLLKGSVTLTATRAGYAEGAYGRSRPGGTSGSLVLDLGERAGDVVIRMWRLGAISGSVTDEAGEPMIGVALRAFQRRYVAGRPRLTEASRAVTDDRGVYRFGGLVPGDYFVAFVSREASLPTAVVEMMRAPAPANDPSAQAIMRERMAVGSMGFPGTPSAIAVGGVVRQINIDGPLPPNPDSSTIFIYPTQFYPGVPGIARAAPLSLRSGQERENIDFALRPVRASRVSGVLAGADGPAANMAVRLVQASDDFQQEAEASVTMSNASGEFMLLGVPAGQYVLKVLRIPRPQTPPQTTATTQVQVGSSMMISSVNPLPVSGLPPIPDDPTMFAEVPVAIADSDVTGLVVALQRGARISGRLEFDGARERPDATAMARVPITLERADAMTSGSPMMSVPPGHADENGTFKTYGLPPGKYFVRVFGPPSGWTVKSITIEGRDITDTPLDLRAADVANVVITFTDRTTRLTGVARDGDGNADSNALVIVFPGDNSGWADYGPNPRRLRSVRTSKTGSYTLTALPPGDYYVAAIKEDAYGQWQDPQTLEELSRRATQVRISEGDTKTQDLKTLAGER